MLESSIKNNERSDSNILHIKKRCIIFFSCIGNSSDCFLSIIFSFSLTVFSLFWGFFGLITIGFLLWIWFGTGYLIEDEKIKIKNGPFKWKVKIQDINSISKKKSLLATPALSVERLVLHYGKYGKMLLSPKNEKEFFELLLAKNPQIKLVEKTP